MIEKKNTNDERKNYKRKKNFSVIIWAEIYTQMHSDNVEAVHCENTHSNKMNINIGSNKSIELVSFKLIIN